MNKIVVLILIILFFIFSKYENYDNDFFNNVVVKIYSQNINFNWLEPYKNKKSNESIGSGFFISNNIILTASHVVQNSIKIYITIPSIGKNRFDTSIICINPYYDFALLRVNDYKSEHYLSLGDSKKIKSGDQVIAIGYPLGQDKLKLTSGIISGIDDGKIQTDAPLNNGNSGGPLLNNFNEVIGINISKYLLADNIGYAVLIQTFYLYQEEMMKDNNKIVFKPILGFTYHNTNKELLDYFNINEEGILVAKVFKNGPMFKAGIKEGDIITKFDNYNLDRYGEVKVDWFGEKFNFKELFNSYKVDDNINISYYRKSKLKSTNLKLMPIKFYKIRTKFEKFEDIKYFVFAGIVFMNLTLNHLDLINNDYLLKYNLFENQLKDVIIITNIMKGSYVNNLEYITSGMVLEKVNGVEVSVIDNLSKILNSSNDKYIIFEFSDGTKLILDLLKTKKEDIFLKKQYKFTN